MKLNEFKKLINDIGERIHENNGEVWTCFEFQDQMSDSYERFLNEWLPDSPNGTMSSALFRKSFDCLFKDEAKSIYQLRLILVATFAAWAIKSGEYRKW